MCEVPKFTQLWAITHSFTIPGPHLWNNPTLHRHNSELTPVTKVAQFCWGLQHLEHLINVHLHSHLLANTNVYCLVEGPHLCKQVHRVKLSVRQPTVEAKAVDFKLNITTISETHHRMELAITTIRIIFFTIYILSFSN